MKKLNKVLSIIISLLLLVTAFALPSSAVGAGRTPFRVTCSFNGNASEARGFCWYTAEQADTKIELFVDGDEVTDSVSIEDVSCKEWEGAFVHKLTVKGLSAGEVYSYRVGDGEVFSETGSFKTDDGDSAFSFLAIADVQASSLENFQKGANTLSAGYATVPEAEFYVNCGDFTNDSTNEEWDLYDQTFSEINRSTTMAPVSGNHDGFGVWHWFDNMFNLDTSESVQTLNGVNYSFDYGNAHLAVLNTNDLLSISTAQLKWLKNDMNKTDKDWKLVFMHKSPYTLGKDGKWPDALYLQSSLGQVLDECGVDLVMSGHDHMYLRTKPLKAGKVSEDGTVYVLAGTAGSKRYEVRSFLADSFMKTEFIDALTVQKGGYGNYWNGTDWESTKETNIGGCFNSISVNGGELTLNSYILSDETGVVTNTDTLTLTKAIGENQATFTGDNSVSELEYAVDTLPSLTRLLTYTLFKWLPRFIMTLPEIIRVYVQEGTF